MPFIKNLTDNDLYKFSMMQLVLHQFPDVLVKYRFKCRTKGVDLKPLRQKIQDEVMYMGTLSFHPTELLNLRGLPHVKDDFIDFLRLFKLNPGAHVSIREQNKELTITVEGPWLHTILWEIYILKIVNNAYFELTDTRAYADVEMEADKRIKEKIELVRGTGIKFADFGTRRAYSSLIQGLVLERLVRSGIPEFVGTSNVYYAMAYKLKPIGTMAHEVFQVCQALTRLEDSQKFAMQKWADEYRGDLGIALADTLGLDKFLKDFDKYFAKLFDGVRQDSGNPEEFADKVIEHYLSLGIYPPTKTIVFSDGLTFERMLEIEKNVGGMIQTSYGIGTNLTNDTGVEPIQIVMKVVEANGKPVAKIADSEGKTMCEDDEYVKYLRKVIA